MSDFIEPRPPKPTLLGKEQDSIIDAALEVLDSYIFEIGPSSSDTATYASHLRTIFYDSLRDNYAVDAIPRLFLDMSQAAMARLHEIMAERDGEGGIP